jgi:hypothetical protein
MERKLLIGAPQIINPKSQNIVEALESSSIGNILLKNILVITAEEKNGNGRYYPKNLWQRELDKFVKKIQEATTETVGELDHPDSQIINLKNGSHIIRSLKWVGDEVRADIEILCDMGPKGNEAGRILGSYLRNGLAIGFSTRGLGSLEQRGNVMEVQDDFEFLTIDAVSNPSNQGSWGRLNESKQHNDPYFKVHSIITDILCSNGSCPIN